MAQTGCSKREGWSGCGQLGHVSMKVGEPNSLVFVDVFLKLYQPERFEGDDESAHFLRSS